MNREPTTSVESYSLFGLRWSDYLKKRTEEARQSFPCCHYHHLIHTDPRLCGGRACLKGRRLTVEDVVGTVANGKEEEEYLLKENPDLTKCHINACLLYAADHRYYEKRRIVNVKLGSTEK